MMLAITTAAFLAIATPSLTGPAGPLHEEWLPEDARWFVHVDVAMATHSPVAGAKNHPIVDPIDAHKYVEDLASLLRLDAREDIRSMTIWGRRGLADPIVTVVVTSARVDELFDRLIEGEDYRRIERDGLKLLTWSEGDNTEPWFGYIRHHPTSPEDRIVVIVQKEVELLIKTVRCIEQPEKPATEAPRGLFKPAEGTVLYAALPGRFDPLGHEIASALFHRSKRITYAVSWTGKELVARLDLLAESSDDARDMVAFVEGYKALTRLRARSGESNRNVLEISESVTSKSDGERVTFEARFAKRQQTEETTQSSDQ